MNRLHVITAVRALVFRGLALGLGPGLCCHGDAAGRSRVAAVYAYHVFAERCCDVSSAGAYSGGALSRPLSAAKQTGSGGGRVSE